ncbi:radical SAM protein [Candidatus Pacearchaeota archaeon]|nr:MAG: radical SAM protein [Candidatus Pacearchaeota archaeon]
MRDLPVITFEVTNICNARCTFCAYRLSTDKKEIMPFKTFQKGLDQFLDVGGKAIVLTPVVGDPLIDPGLFQKIAYAKSKGINDISFYTNGNLLLSNDNYKKIVDCGVTRLDISIGELDKKKHCRIYGIQEQVYDRMLKGLHELLKYNKQKGERVRIIVGFRPMSTPNEVMNSPDFKRVLQPFLSKRVTINIMQVFDNFGGMITPKDLLGNMKLKKPYSQKYYPCVRLYNAISILPQGDVRLCGCRLRKSRYDELVVGNIFKQHLKDIYAGTKAKKIRENFTKNKLPEVCKACTFYEPNM